MKILNSLTQIIPQYLDVATFLTEFKDMWDSVPGVGDEAKEKIDAVKKEIEALEGLLASGDRDGRIVELSKAVEAALNVLKLEDESKYKEITGSKEYQLYLKLTDKWTLLVTPIGMQKKSINESLDCGKAFDKNNLLREYPKADLDFGLKLSVDAGFIMEVMSQAEVESVAGLKISSDHVVVNQDIKAKLSTSAEGAGNFHAITLGAKAEAIGDIEIDSYFQAQSNEKTYRVLENMYREPVLPWDLGNIASSLISVGIDNEADGYRGFSLVRNTKLALTGSLGIGRSLNTVTDVNRQPISIDVGVSATLSRKISLSGRVQLFITKNNEGKVQVNISLLKSQMQGRYFEFAAGAKIKGLDQLAWPQIEKIFGKGNELVELLEKNSTPGKTLVDNLLYKIDDKFWAKPMAQLILGETDVDSAVKKMIGDELQEYFDRTVFSTTLNANELAKSAISKLLETFGITLNEGSQIAPLLDDARTTVESKLAEEIVALQKQTTAAAEKLKEAIEGKASELLLPITKLGEDIAKDIEHFDGKVEALFDKVISRYQTFKEKITKVLEKAANVQLALQLESSREETDSETQALTIVLNRPESAGVQALYKRLILGDDDTSSCLINTLKNSKDIEVIPLPGAFKNILNSKATLSINLVGLDLSNIKNINADLEVSVDATGSVNIVHNYMVKAQAEGFDEVRSAVFKLGYGVAQAALAPSETVALGFDYVNQDKKLHSVREMSDFLESLTLEHLKEKVHPLPLGSLISSPRMMSALNRYKACVTATGNSTAKFRSGNSTSSILITMRTGVGFYQKLVNLNGDSLFNKALAFLVYLDSSDYKDYMLNILAGYQQLSNQNQDLSQIYDRVRDESGAIKEGIIQQDLRRLSDYKEMFARLQSDDSGDVSALTWRRLARHLGRLCRTAQALRNLPVELKNIDNMVSVFPKENPTEEALKTLYQKLNEANHRIETYFGNWIDVEGPLTNIIADFFSSVGVGIAGMNTRLLIFMLLLAEAMGNGKDLYLTRITLESNVNPNKRDVIVV